MKKREMTIFGRFKSIRDAMMLSFSVLVVVAVLIFLLIAMNFTKKTIYENSRTSTSQLISQVNYDIDSYIDYMENISWVAASGSDLSRYLFNQEQTPEEKEAAKERILTQFTTILESRSDIYNVAAVAPTALVRLRKSGLTMRGPRVRAPDAPRRSICATASGRRSGSRAGIRRRSIHRPGSRCHLLMCRMRSQAAITG